MKKYLSMIVILSLLLTCVCSAAAVENEQDSGEPEQTLDIILFDYSSQTETAKTLTAEDSYAHQEYEKWKQSGSRTAFELTAPAYFPNSSDVDCHTVFDEDGYKPVDNVYIYPYTAVLYLRLGQDTNEDGIADTWTNGTGFMAGEKAMVTAAHCFWDATYGWVEECRTYTFQNGETLGSKYYYPFSWVCPKNYTDSLDYQYDWCVVTMADSIGKTTGYFGYGTGGSMVNNEYTISGYPGKYSAYQYTASGTVNEETYYECKYDISMLPGQSGGPVYSSGCIAWAINTYYADSFNQGNRITSWCYDLISEARNASQQCGGQTTQASGEIISAYLRDTGLACIPQARSFA